VAAGQGRVEEAVAGYLEVRAGFLDAGIPYNGALVTMELAELYAARGRAADVLALARQSHAIFCQQGVNAEAQRALDLFRQAAEEERATAELARRIVAYLRRARHDPALRFDAEN
jgi:hypothetical protein